MGVRVLSSTPKSDPFGDWRRIVVKSSRFLDVDSSRNM